MQTEFVELAGEVNQRMPYFCVDRISRALNEQTKPVKGSRIALVGVSYKPGVGDLRESPALRILRLLRDQGAEVSYHDDFVAELPDLGLAQRVARGRRLRRDRHRTPGAGPPAPGRGGAARGRLPRGHPRHRGAAPRAPVTSGSAWSASATGARTSPVTSIACPEPSWPGSATSPRSASSAARRLPACAQLDHLDDLLADDTLDAVVMATPVPTPRASWRCGCWRPASTASSRSRSRNRSSEAEQVVAAARASGRGADGRSPARVPPRRGEAQGDRRRRRAGRHPLHLRQPAQSRQAARRTRTRSGRSARTTCRWCCGWRARSRTRCSAVGESYMQRGHRGRRVLLSCASRPASPRTCTCRGSTRTRSGASRSSARRGWRRSTTWSSSAS